MIRMFVCICKHTFLAKLLGKAGAANDTVACLPPDLFVSVGGGGAFRGLKV